MMNHLLSIKAAELNISIDELVLRACEVVIGMRPSTNSEKYCCRVCSQPTRFSPNEHQESMNGVIHDGLRGWWTCVTENCFYYGKAP